MDQQSLLKEHGYTFEKESANGSIATKDSERYLITNIKKSKNSELVQKIITLKEKHHPHIISIQEIFEDTDRDSCYVVTKHREGVSLAEKIKEKKLEESEALSWIVEICTALKTLHEHDFLHGNLTPKNIFLTEFGKMYLGGLWNAAEKSQNADVKAVRDEGINYQAPEVFKNTAYDAKSEVWSLGCILYELCTQHQAFSAETLELVSKIDAGSAPGLDDNFSPIICDLLSSMLEKDPDLRPTTWEILQHPIAIRSLKEKSQTTVNYLQTQLKKLKEVADNLDQVHRGTTIGSLTGGVIGAAGGITSIVGLILAPFTLGASLIVTGVGIGVGVAGGVTAGASNITNMVSESCNRKAVQSIIKEFDEKVKAVAIWLQEIGYSLESLRNHLSPLPDEKVGSFSGKKQEKAAAGLGKGICVIPAVAVGAVRLAKISRIGQIAAKISRTVRVAEVATGVLSGLFVAFDIFFIALDAKEIHKIRQTKEDGETTSEILKFVQTVRKSADELQKVLDELNETIKSIEEETALEWDYSQFV